MADTTALTGPISTKDVDKARRALAGMRSSLESWLKYRQLNDDVAAGRVISTKLPQAAAAQVALSGRSKQREQKLANHLFVLLSEVMPNAGLPDAELDKDPQAAVRLARIAITGIVPTETASPAAQGNFAWATWPILIVGALLIAVTTKIQSDASLAAEKERLACVRAGACTDYGFWLKAGGIIAIGWFAWTQMGVGPAVRKAIGGGKAAS